ncbi:MAG: hypothetical protein IAF58_15875 [Leptolyngbya sp.]|nr:hypothetical protein [Candidatus Melainabacteria bacterium]
MKKYLLPIAASIVCSVTLGTISGADAETSATSKDGSACDKKAYFEDMSTKIVKSYAVPSGFDVVKAKIGFQLDGNGNVANLKLLNDDDAPAEGQSTVTRTALIKAIKNAAPFASPGELKKPMNLVAFFQKTDAEKPVAVEIKVK